MQLSSPYTIWKYVVRQIGSSIISLRNRFPRYESCRKKFPTNCFQ